MGQKTSHVPLHQHWYLKQKTIILEKSKQEAKADYTIAVISGNFTQRGEVSIVDKWAKAQMAIKNGVDLVIELPTVYATSSAENFAEGAIKILNSSAQNKLAF